MPKYYPKWNLRGSQYDVNNRRDLLTWRARRTITTCSGLTEAQIDYDDKISIFIVFIKYQWAKVFKNTLEAKLTVSRFKVSK